MSLSACTYYDILIVGLTNIYMYAIECMTCANFQVPVCIHVSVWVFTSCCWSLWKPILFC